MCARHTVRTSKRAVKISTYFHFTVEYERIVLNLTTASAIRNSILIKRKSSARKVTSSQCFSIAGVLIDLTKYILEGIGLIAASAGCSVRSSCSSECESEMGSWGRRCEFYLDGIWQDEPVTRYPSKMKRTRSVSDRPFNWEVLRGRQSRTQRKSSEKDEVIWRSCSVSVFRASQNI